MHTHTTTVEYPQKWEQAWLDIICSQATDKTAAIETLLDTLIKPTEVLSNLFTKNRPKHFENYYKQPTYLQAYSLFYFPQSFVRARLPIAEALYFRNWNVLKTETFKIVDLGCGTGPASLGVLDLIASMEPSPAAVEIAALDYAPQALEAFQAIFKKIYADQPGYQLSTHVGKLELYAQSLKLDPTSVDLIILGFSFNEAFTGHTVQEKIQWIQTLGAYLKPSGLILILEPALQSTSYELHTLVDTLLEQKTFYSWGPYWNQYGCPFYKQDTAWSHEVRIWDPPVSLLYLNRTLWRSVRELKYSYSLLGLSPCNTEHLGLYTIRLTSPFSLGKGCFRFNGVTPRGQFFKFELMTRGLSKPRICALESIERGSILNIANPQLLGSSGIDFRIQSDADVSVLYTLS